MRFNSRGEKIEELEADGVETLKGMMGDGVQGIEDEASRNCNKQLVTDRLMDHVAAGLCVVC